MTTLVCDGACTVTLVVTPEPGQNPFVLSLADGAIISGAIIAVWVTAFVFRALSKSLFSEADHA